MMKDLVHSGVGHDDNPPGRGSGRYPWGTGENPEQHHKDFISEVKKLQSQGLKDGEIARMLLGDKAKSIDLRAQISISKKELRKISIARAEEMVQKCNGNISEAARKLGMKNESSLRSLLDPVTRSNTDKYQNTADMIRKRVDEKGIIDIGAKTELYLGCTENTKKIAVQILQNEGYVKSWVKIPQVGVPGQYTTVMVLAKPGTVYPEIYKNRFSIASIQEYTPDLGKTWWKPEFPESLDSKRIMVRYAEEGGAEKDGVIELRKGVEDISLGGSVYAQVRIAVDGTNYAKGMAIYGLDKDFPEGIDVIVNTNKKVGTPMIDKKAVYDPETGTWSGKEVLKRMKIDNATGEVDRENPFGALIKGEKEKDGIIMPGGQRHYVDSKGKEKLSPINKLSDEGDWGSWSRDLANQFLSKQPNKLIKQQIDLSVSKKQDELDEIMSLTNPVVKKRMLEDFAAGCDHTAIKMPVSGFKNQAYQVLIPIPSLKDDEIYAPRFKDGDTVALIRYPHGGTFEIPVLKVNNRNKDAKRILGSTPTDAVGINSHNAEILSGADFDGDTAMVIPLDSNRIKVTHTKPLEGFDTWDPKTLYKLPDTAPPIKNQTKQTQMGIVTNLISDMTIQGATRSEIARAVKHSMVVIDSEKHHLDYKQSAKDNDIQSLKDRYQSGGGASTIFSRSSAKQRIPERREVNDLSKMTPEEQKRWKQGEIIYHETGNTIVRNIKDPKKMTPDELKVYSAGKKVYRKTDELRMVEVPQMSLVRDARKLVRDKDNDKEMMYADYANSLKKMANQARKEARAIKPEKVNEASKKTYSEEVESLNRKLRIAEMNHPRERQAISLANSLVSLKLESNPNMDAEHIGRAKSIALNEARGIVGAKKDRITVTDKEWEAIQANAISSDKIKRIIDNSDLDSFKKLATPRDVQKKNVLSDSKIALMKSMAATGMYTQKEIAERLGVSTSTVSAALKETS